VGAQKGWYVVENPRYHQACWVPQEDIDVPAAAANLRIYPVPAIFVPTGTSAPPPPAAGPTVPGGFSVTNKVCDASSYVVGLSWSDAGGEDGYRVYRDGAVIASLSANVTSYADLSPNYSPHNYFLQAFSSAGYSNGPILSSTGCMF
jgi:hypothetical protein